MSIHEETNYVRLIYDESTYAQPFDHKTNFFLFWKIDAVIVLIIHLVGHEN